MNRRTAGKINLSLNSKSGMKVKEIELLIVSIL